MTTRLERPKLAEINGFLACKRLALVGASRNPRDYTRLLMRELEAKGYDVVPVNPAVPEIEGRACYARVQEIQPPAQAALLLTGPSSLEKVARDCAEAGIQRVWIRTGDALNSLAIAFCRERGMSVITGECPFMFLPNSQWVHRFHAFGKKLVGSYPH